MIILEQFFFFFHKNILLLVILLKTVPHLFKHNKIIENVKCFKDKN